MINRIIDPDDVKIEEITDSYSETIDYCKTISYHNYTDEVVKLKDRTGVITKLNPATSLRYRGEAALVVRIKIQMNAESAIENRNRVLSTPAEDRTFLDRMILEKYSDVMYRNHQPLSLFVQLTVNKSKLKEDRGVTYVEFADAMVFIGQGIEQLQSSFIPGTEDYDLERISKEMLAEEEIDKSGASFVFLVKIVDNESVILPEYWTNIANRVFSIRAVRDPRYQSGIYVIHREPECMGASRDLLAKYYSPKQFSTVEDFPLYQTRSEAENNPSHPEMRNYKEMLAEQVARAAKAEAELNAARWRAQHERAKQEEDLKQTRRKNTAESFKYVPMIINGLITLAMIAISLLTKTPVKPLKV